MGTITRLAVSLAMLNLSLPAGDTFAEGLNAEERERYLSLRVDVAVEEAKINAQKEILATLESELKNAKFERGVAGTIGVTTFTLNAAIGVLVARGASREMLGNVSSPGAKVLNLTLMALMAHGFYGSVKTIQLGFGGVSELRALIAEANEEISKSEAAFREKSAALRLGREGLQTSEIDEIYVAAAAELAGRKESQRLFEDYITSLSTDLQTAQDDARSRLYLFGIPSGVLVGSLLLTGGVSLAQGYALRGSPFWAALPYLVYGASALGVGFSQLSGVYYSYLTYEQLEDLQNRVDQLAEPLKDLKTSIAEKQAYLDLVKSRLILESN